MNDPTPAEIGALLSAVGIAILNKELFQKMTSNDEFLDIMFRNGVSRERAAQLLCFEFSHLINILTEYIKNNGLVQ